MLLVLVLVLLLGPCIAVAPLAAYPQVPHTMAEEDVRDLARLVHLADDALECMLWRLECMLGRLECMLGWLECVLGRLESVECMLGRLECVLGRLECMLGWLECMLGRLECMLLLF